MQKLEPYMPSPYDEREQVLPRQVNLPSAEELELPTKIVAKPVLERKAKPAARTKNTVVLEPPKQEALKEAIAATQELPKAPPSPPPLQPLKTSPEPVKTVSETPPWPWPGCDRPVQETPPALEQVSKRTVIPKLEEATVPPAIPPLVKVQKGGAPVAKEPVIPTLEKIQKPASAEAKVGRTTPAAEGPPPLQPIKKPEVAKVEEVVKEQKIVLEKIIKPDELFVIYGIADNEIDFRGIYTRANLAGVDGYDVKDKAHRLLHNMLQKDLNEGNLDREWVQRYKQGYCSATAHNGATNPFVRIVACLKVTDSNAGRNLAVWQDAGEENSEPHVVYRYIMFRTKMNEPIGRVPLHLL